MLIAGGTDLLPNMKRRQQVPGTLVALRHVADLRRVENGHGSRARRGLDADRAGASPLVREGYPGLWQAAVTGGHAAPAQHGHAGRQPLSGHPLHLLRPEPRVETAIGFCMKKDGETCWVAPSSSRCLAVSSTDTAPALIALGAQRPAGLAGGEREVALEELYRNDGIDYIDAPPGRDPHRRAARRPGRLEEHLLEAAPPRIVRLPGAVRGRGGAPGRRRDGRAGAHRAGRWPRGRNLPSDAAAALEGQAARRTGSSPRRRPAP